MAWDRSGPEASGFTVLDGAALVAGAAVSAVHLRGVMREDLVGPGWVLLWGTFCGIALTAAGPFVYLFRRRMRPFAGHPRVGDRLWALQGLPWLASTWLQARPVANGGSNPWGEWLAVGLVAGVGLSSLIALAVVWRTWVMVPAGQAAETFSGPWTNRLGLGLAIAWPLQCGAVMVVLG